MFINFKKIMATITTAILIFLMSIPAATANKKDDYLRIGVLYGSSAASEFTLVSESGFVVGIENDRIFTEEKTIENTELKITTDENGFIHYGEEIFDTSSNQRLTFFSAGDNLLSGNEKKYRGGLEFLNVGNGLMTVINFLTVDDYVKGVVPREVPASWHIEALKAQAVCARNYSITNKNKHKSENFDVCTTVHCQVYGGFDAEKASTNNAVDATAGEYLKYEGKLAQTLFSSSTGGHTGNAKYVWGNDIPYLRGVANDFETPADNPRYTWTKTLTTEQIELKLIEKNIAIGSIKTITSKIDETTGQVYELTINGTNGSHTFKNDGTRGCFGSDVLLSQFYAVTPVTTPATSGILAITSNGKKNLSDYCVISKNGNTSSITFPFTIKSAATKETVNPQAMAYRFDGRGWGHGLGLSQYGAKGMADKGYTYKQILEHFYPGTVLE